MSEVMLDDDGCRRLAAIFPGAALDAQVRNEEYLLSRCAPQYAAHHRANLRNFRRAVELRASDATADG